MPSEIVPSSDHERSAMMAIPNIVPQAIVLLFYITAYLFGAPVTMILENTLCEAAAMLLMFGFFLMGYISGGGAKLIASLPIWLGFSKVLGLFLILNAAILVMAVLVLRIVRPLLKTDKITGIPVLPVVILEFLTVFPKSELFRQVSPRLETMITDFLPHGSASQPPLPATGVVPLRSTIVPAVQDFDTN